MKKLKQYWLPLVLLLLSLSLFGRAGYLQSKAVVAQWLMQESWHQQKAFGKQHPPWPWADGYVIAQLEFPQQGQEYLVMSDASGRNLAFGPGHLSGTALPGTSGHAVISGHKDSHFAILEEVAVGEVITLHSQYGKRSYRVTNAEVVDSAIQPFVLEEQDKLTLITCYPFDRLTTGGSLRYLVHAELVRK